MTIFFKDDVVVPIFVSLGLIKSLCFVSPICEYLETGLTVNGMKSAFTLKLH